jgi:serine/threonine-protein phosphatase 2B catalytic subunit
MTEHFTFKEEVLQKYKDQEIYNLFLESFEAMPVAAIVNKDYLCVHGGISPDMVTVDEINRKVERFKEPSLQGLLCDLLWSDPVDDTKATKVTFKENEERECSFKFGYSPVKEFLKKNCLLSIVRAHQVQLDGYKMHKWGGAQAFPPVMTVFSAPNYCGTYNNKGAVILLENDSKLTIKQYRNVEHPYHLPKNMDLFSFSIPYLAEQVSGMLVSVVGKSQGGISPLTQSEKTGFVQALKDNEIDEANKKKIEKLEILRNKVKAIARM